MNTPRYQRIQVKNGECSWEESKYNFDPICMNNLKEIVTQFDAYIVISSTWRYGCIDNDRDWTELLGNLNRYGLRDRVIGVTPDLTARYSSRFCRGYEIKEWLDGHADIENFVIIDDGDDMYELIGHLAQCDYDDGLTNEVKEECCRILTSS